MSSIRFAFFVVKQILAGPVSKINKFNANKKKSAQNIKKAF